MTDLKEQLRVYFDEISPPFDTADLKHEPLLRPTPVRSRVGRGVLVAAATAALLAPGTAGQVAPSSRRRTESRG